MRKPVYFMFAIAFTALGILQGIILSNTRSLIDLSFTLLATIVVVALSYGFIFGNNPKSELRTMYYEWWRQAMPLEIVRILDNVLPIKQVTFGEIPFATIGHLLRYADVKGNPVFDAYLNEIQKREEGQIMSVSDHLLSLPSTVRDRAFEEADSDFLDNETTSPSKAIMSSIRFHKSKYGGAYWLEQYLTQYLREVGIDAVVRHIDKGRGN